jgi:hypothetical protein
MGKENLRKTLSHSGTRSNDKRKGSHTSVALLFVWLQDTRTARLLFQLVGQLSFFKVADIRHPSLNSDLSQLNF